MYMPGDEGHMIKHANLRQRQDYGGSWKMFADELAIDVFLHVCSKLLDLAAQLP